MVSRPARLVHRGDGDAVVWCVAGARLGSRQRYPPSQHVPGRLGGDRVRHHLPGAPRAGAEQVLRAALAAITVSGQADYSPLTHSAISPPAQNLEQPFTALDFLRQFQESIAVDAQEYADC